VTTSPPKICIVSHNAYGTLSGRQNGLIGGVEWQTSLFARWLVNRGHKVSFLTWDEGGGAEEMIDGIRVIKICRRGDGIPGMRFFHPKWSRLVGALRKADAEVYYHNCGECVTGQIALWCRTNNRGFVFSAANETDCDASLPELKYWKDRLLYRMGLRNASRLIVQTSTQREMMRTNFSVEALVIPMPCEKANPPLQTSRARPPSSRVLWVARVCPQKRPDRLVEVARMLPRLHFDLVGPHYPDAMSARAVKEAGELPNITVHGRLQRHEVANLYRGAACLISTSDYEGFPNTFLEAWSHALPIVSTFDPDGLISSRQLGIIAHDAAGLAESVQSMLASDGLYAKLSASALSYYLENHTVEAVQPRFEQVLVDVARLTRERRISAQVTLF
jgi:glycosyltransferase involved in cell wall biosynthesis